MEKNANQDQLRQRLLNLIDKQPQSIKNLSKEIGVHELTLRNFLFKQQNVRFLTEKRILNYIQKNED